MLVKLNGYPDHLIERNKVNEIMVKKPTEFRKDQQEDKYRRDDGDEASRERPAVEVLVDLRVSVQIPDLVQDIHSLRPDFSRRKAREIKKQ